MGQEGAIEAQAVLRPDHTAFRLRGMVTGGLQMGLQQRPLFRAQGGRFPDSRRLLHLPPDSLPHPAHPDNAAQQQVRAEQPHQAHEVPCGKEVIHPQPEDPAVGVGVILDVPHSLATLGNNGAHKTDGQNHHQQDRAEAHGAQEIPEFFQSLSSFMTTPPSPSAGRR